MKYIYPKTIFINEDGEVIPNNYDKTKFTQKKEWYERKIIQGDKITEPKTVNQRYVILTETRNKQLEFRF